jgi:L,D-transpeptidase catalytic domain
MTVRVIFGIAAVTLLAGCGGTHSAVKGAAKQLCAAGSTQPVGGKNVAWAAVVRRPLTAFREPGARPIAHFGLLNVNHVNTVFGVLSQQVNASCRPTWLHVQLPLRPNGSTGWVRADHVQRLPVRTRIVVDLSQKVVSFFKNGRLVLHTRAAIGSSATPTPLGRYYVNQRLIPDDPTGPFGPGAIGISAFSPVLTGWAQGGPVAIHGTNEPWSIGRAVSNGCIRVPNRVLRRLFAQTPAGTPVIIKR